MYREHTVYKVETKLEPIVKLTQSGTLDWGSVIEFQSNHKERNELIISIIKKYKERHILVLCKRISQANYLEKRLLEEKEILLGVGSCLLGRGGRVTLSTLGLVGGVVVYSIVTIGL